MDARNYLLTYVAQAYGGNRRAAADALGIPYPTFAHICNGTRGVSAKMARKLALNSNGELNPARLIFIKADPGKAA